MNKLELRSSYWVVDSNGGIVTTGSNGIACAMEGLLFPESAAVHCGPCLDEVREHDLMFDIPMNCD